MNMLKLTLAQLNYTLGDFEGNRQKMLDARVKAIAEGSDLVIYSELSVTGYPPEDLVYRPAFRQLARDTVLQLAAATNDGKAAMLIGCPWEENGNIHNATILLAEGTIRHIQYKHDLPNYGVFDEKRVFTPGGMPEPVLFKGVKLGLMVCEDMWNMTVADALKDSDIILSINASPFEVGKHTQRLARARANVERIGKPLVYVNQLCGQDDLVFDGDSFVLSGQGEMLWRLSRTQEEVATTEWQNENGAWRCTPGLVRPYPSWQQVMYQAMVLALRDYVGKNGFPGVLIGMSGGIDSALSAAVAVDALGADKVWLVMMPSRYTSPESFKDAENCTKLLGAKLDTIPIEDMFMAFEEVLAPTFSGKERDITEENIQSRIRGTLLMALSNKFGHMVLSTGNKSEMAVGYATLYGDMAGGYNVLKDAYKTQVNGLSEWRNSHVPENGLGPKGLVIPDTIIRKAPTAELRPDQKDEDSLPPYALLDAILHRIIEEEKSIAAIMAEGYDEATVRKVRKLVYRAEYKRRQSAPGVKLSKKPFGRDRRYPITNRFGS